MPGENDAFWGALLRLSVLSAWLAALLLFGAMWFGPFQGSVHPLVVAIIAPGLLAFPVLLVILVRRGVRRPADPAGDLR